MPSLSDFTDLAVEPHKKLKMDQAVPTLLDETASQLVGQPLNRIDGRLKVSGQAPYAAEYYLDDQLFGVLVSATISKGSVIEVLTEEAIALPGVVDVIVDFDTFLRNSQQGGKRKAPTQGAKDIFYYGQPIAVAVAETFEAATQAAKSIQVRYQDESASGAFDFEAEKSNASTMASAPPKSQGNPDDTLAQADVSVDVTYHTPSQNNAAMEPHASTATWSDDQLTVYTANQMLATCKLQLADALGIKPDQVRLVSRYVGGGFGGKLGIAPESVAAAVAAKQLGRPVQVVMTRPQVMEATVRRSNTEQRVALGADKDGHIHTIIHDSIVTNLPDESFYEPTAKSTPFLYAGDNRRISYKMVRMNQVLAGSMRAPGEAVGQIALECAMDELAEKLNLDPIELRVRNEPKKDPTKDIPFSTRQLVACMQSGAKKFGWDQRQSRPASVLDGDWLVGMGMAAASRVNELKPSQARATLKLNPQKLLGIEAIIETDMTDIGTGTYTVLSQITADLLGLPMDHITVKLGDSDLPPASGSGGSVGAASSGSSVYLACQKLREMIAEQVGLQADTIELDNGIVSRNQGNPQDPTLMDNLKTSLTQSAKAVTTEVVEKVAGKVGIPVQRVDTPNFAEGDQRPLQEVLTELENNSLKAVGEIKPGSNEKDYRQACYGANFVEVGVHRTTGEIRVRRMTGVFTAGRILNHKTATSQCYGGMVFGIGSALMEEIIHDKISGRMCNHDLAEYHLAVNADVPQLDVTLLEEDDPLTNPIHIKGIGETAISGAAAAIANAVYNATGIRVREFPITLDKLLDQLPELDSSAHSSSANAALRS